MVCPVLNKDSPYARPNVRKIHRSNSVCGRILLGDDTENGGTPLSRKFQNCFVDEDSGPVFEIGSFQPEKCKSDSEIQTKEDSDKEGISTFMHPPRTAKSALLDGKKVLTSLKMF